MRSDQNLSQAGLQRWRPDLACVLHAPVACVAKSCMYIIHMGSGQNALSRSLYKTTYLVVGVIIFIYNTRRHATRAP